MMVNVALRLDVLRRPLDQSLQTAARWGAAGVQIDARRQLPPSQLSQTGLRQLRKQLSDLHLRVGVVAFPTRAGLLQVDQLDRRLAAVKDTLRFAHALGARVVVTQLDGVPEAPPNERGTLAVDVLTDIGRHGLHVGATLALQTGPGCGPELAQLLDALPEGTAGVSLDPGRLVVAGYSVDETLAAVGRHVIHVAASDATRDLSLGRGVPTPLGRGSVDYPTILATLAEQRFGGYFTVEPDPTDLARDECPSIDYLKNLVAE